jgi:hypothetical protein
MILFLDFDGVLHPEPCGDEGEFCRVPLFWQILRTCPNVSVVLSTSWRSLHRTEELLAFATTGGGEDLIHRFVGSTPSIIQERGANIAGRVYRREAECLEWLRHHGGQNQPWLALDDYPVEFRGPKLYFVDRRTGLTEADVAAIIQRIQP